MIERNRAIFEGERFAASVPLKLQEVLACYKEVHGVIPQYIERMIMLYPNWRYEILTPGEVGRLTWYFDNENPHHISWKLTHNGKRRQVEEVAKTYLSLRSKSLASFWGGVSKIESMIEVLKKGEKSPPLIIVKGSRYPEAPGSSFIDGVHRALAIAVYNLTTPNNNLEIEAYVGRKPSLPSRIIRRVNSVFY